MKTFERIRAVIFAIILILFGVWEYAYAIDVVGAPGAKTHVTNRTLVGDSQHPLATNNDSIYTKDVIKSKNNTGTFTGDVNDLFDNLYTTITDTSATNPKYFEFFLERPVNNGSININTPSGTFSNVKIILKNSQGDTVKTIDDSANDTDYKNHRYHFTTKNYCCIRIEFHTTDTVTLGGLFIQKNSAIVIDSIDGFISDKNSSQTPLGASGVFTGEAEDSKDYGAIQIALATDVAGTFLIEGRSTTSSTWREIDSYAVAAGEDKAWSFQGVRRFIRVIYTNGGDAQSYFDLQVVFKPVYVKPSSHPIGGVIKSNDDAELVKAQTTGERPDGTYGNVQVTTDNNFKIANAEDTINIARGNVTGYSVVHKFGRGADIDTADGMVDLWDGAEYDTSLESYTFSTTADIDRISSDNASDTEPIEIQCLDSNWDLVTQTKTLTGQTPVVLDTSCIRGFRMINVGTNDLVGNVFLFVNVTTTAGVPDTLTNIRAMINDGNNQTLMAIYTIPNGKTGYIVSWFGALSSAKASSFNNLEMKARPFGQVFQLKHTSTLSSAGTSHIQHTFFVPQTFPGKTDFIMKSDSSVNDNAVSAGFDLILIDN